MTDSGLVAKKLAYIETCVKELRTLAHPEALQDDIREQRFVAYTLQTAIQAALDVAAHIVADERLGEPRTNRELFENLVRHGWVPESLSIPLRQMAGFRNIVVHGYEAVDMAVVEGILRNRLDDLLAFVAAIRTKL
ncbi:MAG TPA: DUF86 domain-containing protein [Thermoanaerobaculia bacterium]